MTGYDVHYTSNTSVAAGATVQSVSAAAGWLAHPTRTATDTSTSQTISSLSNGTPYRVRVRGEEHQRQQRMGGAGRQAAEPTRRHRLVGHADAEDFVGHLGRLLKYP